MSHSQEALRHQLLTWFKTLEQAAKTVKEVGLDKAELETLLELFEKRAVEDSELDTPIDIKDLLEGLEAPNAGIESAHQVFTQLKAVQFSERLIAQQMADIKSILKASQPSIQSQTLEPVNNKPFATHADNDHHHDVANQGLHSTVPQPTVELNHQLLMEAFEGLFEGLFEEDAQASSFIPGAKVGYVDSNSALNKMLTSSGQEELKAKSDLQEIEDFSEAFHRLFNSTTEATKAQESDTHAPGGLLDAIQIFSKSAMKSLLGTNEQDSAQSQESKEPEQQVEQTQQGEGQQSVQSENLNQSSQLEPIEHAKNDLQEVEDLSEAFDMLFKSTTQNLELIQTTDETRVLESDTHAPKEKNDTKSSEKVSEQVLQHVEQTQQGEVQHSLQNEDFNQNSQLESIVQAMNDLEEVEDLSEAFDTLFNSTAQNLVEPIQERQPEQIEQKLEQDAESSSDTKIANEPSKTPSSGSFFDEIRNPNKPLKHVEFQPPKVAEKSPLLQGIEGFSKTTLNKVPKPDDSVKFESTKATSEVGQALLKAISAKDIAQEQNDDDEFYEMQTPDLIAKQVISPERLDAVREQVKQALSGPADKLANKVALLTTEKLFELSNKSPELVSAQEAQEEYNKIFEFVGQYLDFRLEGIDTELLKNMEMKIEDDIWGSNEPVDDLLPVWEESVDSLVEILIDEHKSILNDFASKIDSPTCQLRFFLDAQGFVQNDYGDVLNKVQIDENVNENPASSIENPVHQDDGFLVKALNGIRGFISGDLEDSDSDDWSDEDEYESFDSESEFETMDNGEGQLDNDKEPSKLSADSVDKFAKLFSGIGKSSSSSEDQSEHSPVKAIESDRIDGFAKLFGQITKGSAQSEPLKQADLLSDIDSIEGLEQDASQEIYFDAIQDNSGFDVPTQTQSSLFGLDEGQTVVSEM